MSPKIVGQFTRKTMRKFTVQSTLFVHSSLKSLSGLRIQESQLFIPRVCSCLSPSLHFRHSRWFLSLIKCRTLNNFLLCPEKLNCKWLYVYHHNISSLHQSWFIWSVFAHSLDCIDTEKHAFHVLQSTDVSVIKPSLHLFLAWICFLGYTRHYQLCSEAQVMLHGFEGIQNSDSK